MSVKSILKVAIYNNAFLKSLPIEHNDLLLIDYHYHTIQFWLPITLNPIDTVL